MKKDVGMAKHFSKKYGNKGWAFNYLRIKVMSRCLSAPDATSLHHCLQNHRQYYTILSWIQALDTTRPVVSLGYGISWVYAISFLFSKCSTFPASWGHGQSYANISHTLHNCTQYYILGYLPLKAYQFVCLFLRQCCRDVASGADRYLDITFIRRCWKLIPCFRTF